MESLADYVNRVGTDNAKGHYGSEIESKLATIQQIYSLYEEGESIEPEDLERIGLIESLIEDYRSTISEIDSLPFVEEPYVIKPYA